MEHQHPTLGSRHSLSTASTRNALLQAAENLFASRGYAAVGIREIADLAHANVASINYHFGSKKDLYLQMVAQAMTRDQRQNPWALLDHIPANPRDAAATLVRFVRGYLHHLLDPGPGNACGRLMLWEAIQPSDAFEVVVENYIRPGHDLLTRLVECLLPSEGRLHLGFSVRSILGQMLHYRVCQPFLRSLETRAGRWPIDAREAADHIVRFSLRAMGHDAEFIEEALAQADSPAEATLDLDDETDLPRQNF